MQAAGIQPGGQVALSVAQRSVLGNPGGATGNLGGAATVQRRGRSFFKRQVQAATPQQAGVPQGQAGTQQGGVPQGQAGTPTNGNNPVATQLLLAPTFTPVQANLVLDTINMRVAFPVSAIDGEYIITMQTGGAQAQAPEAAPQQGQAPPTPEGQGQRPATPEGQGQRPATPEGQGQQPATPEGQAPTPEREQPAGETAAGATPAGEARPAEGQAPALEGAAGNGTALAAESATKPEGEAANATAPALEAEQRPEGEKKAERRQENKEPAIGDTAPQGSVYITMKEVNQMVSLMQWGGQAPISEMMTEYVKANNASSTN